MKFERITNDINGNPRYVTHFLNIDPDYPTAVKIANTIGGRKYNTRAYGGGIVFQSYSIPETEKYLKKAIEEAKQ